MCSPPASRDRTRDRLKRTDIKTLRKKAGLRQEDLALLCGVSRQTIIAIENDKYDPTLALAMKLASVLGIAVEGLFFPDDGSASEPR